MSESKLKAIYERWERKRNPMKAAAKARKKHYNSRPLGKGSAGNNSGGVRGVAPLTSIIRNEGLYGRRD